MLGTDPTALSANNEHFVDVFLGLNGPETRSHLSMGVLSTTGKPRV